MGDEEAAKYHAKLGENTITKCVNANLQSLQTMIFLQNSCMKQQRYTCIDQDHGTHGRGSSAVSQHTPVQGPSSCP